MVREDFWWGKVDSDHRSRRQQIYSLPPLAAREFPLIRLSLSVTEMKRLSKTGGAGEGSRTPNLLITNQLLCH